YLELGERLHTVFRRIETLDKPTLSAVNGWALGGGTELILCTDIRIAADSAKFGLPEITLGLFPGAGGSQRLLRQVSPCKAKELMFVGS
ncbi:enoyl-CoA hydratase/isomerase family protein, partial [Acinetobacter baumannii]